MNKSEIYLEGKTIFLKILQNENASSDYLSWLNDSEVIQYLECRHSPTQTLNELRTFISSAYEAANQYLFGIFDKETGKHIGNIKLGDISSKYLRGDIGLFIGEKSFWGKGIAAEAIKLVTEFGFIKLNLQKICAGAYDVNLGSIKAFTKNGFQIEGTLKQQYRLDTSEWVDAVYLGKVRSEHE